MAELEVTELKILRPENKRRLGIEKMKRSLADEYSVPLKLIGHCIDGEEHHEFGANTGFLAMKEKGKKHQEPVLVAKTADGQPAVPYAYLGSRPHGKRFVHFYLNEKRTNPEQRDWLLRFSAVHRRTPQSPTS